MKNQVYFRFLFFFVNEAENLDGELSELFELSEGNELSSSFENLSSNEPRKRFKSFTVFFSNTLNLIHFNTSCLFCAINTFTPFLLKKIS
jgi:hypothetical protein